jgi:multisubunit Na+/H+ antiporter MnhB subunit
MLGFIYWLCVIISLVLVAIDWDKQRNKVNSLVLLVLALLPLINIVVTVILLKRNWPMITKWFNEFAR